MLLATRFEEISDIAVLEQRWRALETKAEDGHNFFLRWTWIGSWLGALLEAGKALPQLLVVEATDGGDVALALIGRGEERRKLGKLPALWLNEVGDKDGDRPFIEYNGILCAKGKGPAVVHSFCAAIAGRRDWKALHLSGLPFGSPLIDVPGVRRRVLRDASPAYHVDLRQVWGCGGDYLSLLSANSRNQIRRSVKDEGGAPKTEAAGDAATALRWLDEMVRLGSGRRADNAWDSMLFVDFARRITLAGLKDGSVELLRVANGEEEAIGYLLNFLWAGRAMNYQSAFAVPRTPKSKPGLMAHAAAVDRYQARGLDVYSLLAGKDRYKQSLSTGAEMLEWWTLERRNWRLEVEAAARRMLRR
jgi:hypothetical protein